MAKRVSGIPRWLVLLLLLLDDELEPPHAASSTAARSVIESLAFIRITRVVMVLPSWRTAIAVDKF